MLRLLIVDDEKMTRDILVNYIPWSSLGIDSVEEAEDGLCAFNMALQSKPDIVLSDVRMPRMNGIELATQLREHLPNCKFVFLSGYSDKEYLKSAIRLKAVSYVEKPINLDEIKEVMQATIHEYREEQREREENQALVRPKLCHELIVSRVNLPSVKEKVALLGLDFPEDSQYITAILRLNPEYQEMNEEHPEYKEKILELLDESLKKSIPPYISSIKGEEYIILLCRCDQLEDLSQLKDLLDDFVSQLKAAYFSQIKVMIGIGQRVTGLENINQSYRSAVVALQKQFYKGYGSVLFYTEDSGAPYEFDENALLEVGENVKAGKKNESILFIKRLSNDIRKYENTPPDLVKNYFFKIILVLSRIAEDRNIPFLNDECKFILDGVSRACTLEDLEKSVIELLSSIITYMETRLENGDIVSKITAYINEHYSNEDLSINTIAEALYLTPTYLCVLYKKETGKTINQYITEVRVNKAKEYLKEADIKLYDVAKRVGYGDGKYFTKVFEKAVGMRPKQYREIHCYDNKNI
ncbi:MAG: response regulator [Clostridia bacterium]|nr:response regulator [Clostridia bacterium]